MATWGAHMRVAEEVLKFDFDLDEKAFLVGNLGPDCNQANEDWTEFKPPKEITHWFNENNQINVDDFYNTYLLHCNKEKEEKSFLIGYYTHLISDIEWSKMVKSQKEKNSNLNLEVDKETVRKIKKDWYDLDHLYFRNNKQSIFYKILKNIDEFPDYLDYFPSGAITKKLKYIIKFYDSFNGDLDREFTYLTKKEMDNYVENTTRVVSRIFKNRCIGSCR